MNLDRRGTIVKGQHRQMGAPASRIFVVLCPPNLTSLTSQTSRFVTWTTHTPGRPDRGPLDPHLLPARNPVEAPRTTVRRAGEDSRGR